VTNISHDSTADLEEMDMGRETIKNNRFRKTFHQYGSVIEEPSTELSFLGRFVIFEINTYGNPYPYEKRMVKSFITEAMEKQGVQDAIVAYDMAPFELNVLDKRRTMVEKIVSLLRFSFDDSEVPTSGLASKIRHFYDLYHLAKDAECATYLKAGFSKDLLELIVHDKAEYDRPPKWKSSDILTSILFTVFDKSWEAIKATYKKELRQLAYVAIPDEKDVAASVKALMEYVRTIIEQDREKSQLAGS